MLAVLQFAMSPRSSLTGFIICFENQKGRMKDCKRELPPPKHDGVAEGS